MRVIDAEPIIEELYKIGNEKDEAGEHEFALGIDTVIYLLEQAKAVDAVSTADDDLVRVVRCKDCMYYNEDNMQPHSGWCECLERGEYNEHFCSYGEPKEG